MLRKSVHLAKSIEQCVCIVLDVFTMAELNLYKIWTKYVGVRR